MIMQLHCRLIATIASGVLLLTPTANAAIHYQVLKSFGAVTNDGQTPYAGVIQDTNGFLYGTTRYGGSNGLGTIFKIGSGYSVLHHFRGTNIADGAEPQSGLVLGSDGVLFGVAPFGGSNHMGIIYRLLPDGNGYVILHHFGTNVADGQNPYGRLIEASDGVLYGTTSRGGRSNMGTVFKIGREGGSFSVLHSFTNYDYPRAGLVETAVGTLAGLSLNGMFKVNKDGSGFTNAGNATKWGTLLASGESHLVEGSDGVLYGQCRTLLGGSCSSYARAFQADLALSEFHTLRFFSSCSDEGTSPDGGLVEDGKGVLYGTLFTGGAGSGGSAFMVNTDGSSFRVLHSFNVGNGDGAFPRGALLRGNGGAFYGTTSAGGEFGFGTVFKLWPPPRMLPPMLTNGGVMVRFTDIPGASVELQRTSELDGSWSAITNLIVPPNGAAEFMDATPLEPAGFYRVHETLPPTNSACIAGTPQIEASLATNGYAAVNVKCTDSTAIVQLHAFLVANFTVTSPLPAGPGDHPSPLFRRGNASGFHSFSALQSIPWCRFTITTGPDLPGADPGILHRLCNVPGVVQVTPQLVGAPL